MQFMQIIDKFTDNSYATKESFRSETNLICNQMVFHLFFVRRVTDINNGIN